MILIQPVVSCINPCDSDDMTFSWRKFGLGGVVDVKIPSWKNLDKGWGDENDLPWVRQALGGD